MRKYIFEKDFKFKTEFKRVRGTLNFFEDEKKVCLIKKREYSSFLGNKMREISDRELYEKSGVNCFNYRTIQNIE